MNVHDPRDTRIQVEPTAVRNDDSQDPAPTQESHRHITILLTLAGKNGYDNPANLQNFLLQNPDVTRLAAEILTSTNPAMIGRDFDQLFPMKSIEAYLDQESHPLPGAEPRICNGATHMVEIPWNDATCNTSARHDYLQRILLPVAREHVVEALQYPITSDALAAATGSNIQEIFSLVEALSATTAFHGTPDAGSLLQHVASLQSDPTPDPNDQ